MLKKLVARSILALRNCEHGNPQSIRKINIKSFFCVRGHKCTINDLDLSFIKERFDNINRYPRMSYSSHDQY